jgi:toxin ParE1/3/4
MAVHLIWTKVAQKDLKEIIGYIRKDNPSAAKSFSNLLVERAEILTKFPEMGHIVPECEDPEIREISYRSYRIIYRFIPTRNMVEIARLWHAARGEPEFENPA